MDTLRGVNYTYTFNASTSSISLDNYKPYTPYKIKMFAFSRNGVGNTSVAVHVTTEEDGENRKATVLVSPVILFFSVFSVLLLLFGLYFHCGYELK